MQRHNEIQTVLSAFDGIGCSRLALNQLGIKPKNFYASENDKYATSITKKHFNDIVHLGDITKITGEEITEPVDLLIGGSPCQGFSKAGDRLNFEDPRSRLFWDFVRLLKVLKPRYFLLENVVMNKESSAIISEALEYDFIQINSSLVSAQNRRRLYWTNLQVTQPDDRNITLQSILEKDVDEHYYLTQYQKDFISDPVRLKKKYTAIDGDKSLTLKKDINQLQGTHVTDTRGPTSKSNIRKLTPVEAERLQNIPDGYTETGIMDGKSYHLTNARRFRLLGNGFNVNTISWILSPLLLEKPPTKEKKAIQIRMI